MMDYLQDVASLLLRWLHVVAAIAWIGESFYFVMLDRALKTPKDPADRDRGVRGELWSVHGGGFYHKQKYLVAPGAMPEDLHWSKWKSYTTWLSGFALFALMYLLDPQLYLIDPTVRPLAPTTAVLAALGFIVAGWFVYDLLCRLVGFRDALLGIVVALFVLAVNIVATQLFSGRAAFLISGAMLATIMSANVFFVIIPGQKRMVATLAAGATPDPLPGLRGKQRSVHNTYFTLPVVFTMLSNHYAYTYAHPQNWLVLSAIMVAGALIRQFFVVWHAGARQWGLLAAGGAVLAAVLAWLAPTPRPQPLAPPVATAAHPTVTGAAATDPAPPATAELLPLFATHCGGCHAAQPRLLASAPQGVMFDTAAQIEQRAGLIYQQVVALRVMPPGNMTQMSEAERAAIGRWYLARPQ